ncbi:hypothetical protein [Limnoglobus roseus]|uniref:Uncharacterized protein n=1 Tax=Limnoglobus roseus TaxID=2598579 RepID=A0A5C1A4A2_9BACT|nr:hypothetical protein [Limnoglobus roseus]QEL13919.1 hypothetical protein PX52LOC_00779 [Limnoglobus roseus]
MNAAAGRVPCGHCGAKVAIPAGHSRAKIRCEACGYYADVPPELRSAEAAPPPDDLPVITPAPPAEDTPRPRNRSAEPPPVERSPRKTKKPTAKARPNPDPADPRPQFEMSDDAPRGPNLLEGTQDEDDDKPYAVPGDGTKACPECNCRVPLDATMCVHCGVDFQSRRKPKKAFQPIDQAWEPRMSLQTRLKILAGLQVVNLLLMLLISNAGSFAGGVLSLLFQGGLQAFLLGSYEKLLVKRTAKGQATLTVQWRIAFVPVAPIKVDWKKSHAIGPIATYTPGLVEWFTFIYLLFLFVLPGVLFYFYVIHPVRFQIVLCDNYGSTDQVIFRTTSQEQADEVCSVTSTATGLQYRPVM